MDGADGFTRKAFLRRSGAAGAALLGGSLWAAASVAARARRQVAPGDPPIRTLVISCQENRSFDSYFGFAPEVQRRGFGPPPGFSQPDAAGRSHPVFHQTALTSGDPSHSWAGAHLQYGDGRMDGFFKASGDTAIGYYTADELPFYYSLFGDPDAALCANYFSSVIGSSPDTSRGRPLLIRSIRLIGQFSQEERNRLSRARRARSCTSPGRTAPNRITSSSSPSRLIAFLTRFA